MDETLESTPPRGDPITFGHGAEIPGPKIRLDPKETPSDQRDEMVLPKRRRGVTFFLLFLFPFLARGGAPIGPERVTRTVAALAADAQTCSA